MTRKSLFVCQACEYRTGKWLGRCPECGTWDSFVEQRTDSTPSTRAPSISLRAYPEIDVTEATRTSTGLGELDRVLGGGLVPGAVILVGGEPGVGKSTLLLQVASEMAANGRRVLYASGEESAAQLRSRGDRLGIQSPELLIAAETDVDSLIAAARDSDVAALVIDSIQAVRCSDIASVAGTVTQVRESAGRFVNLAKTTGLPILLVGHVTKQGGIAGPRTLEHVVDTVTHFEGDRHHEHRILRALKNRFGSTDELGVFRMTDRGLEEIANPSELLLAERRAGVPGSAVLAAVEGTRPLLVEIQALVGDPVQGSPRRTTLGVDSNRVALILAVVQRHAGLDLTQRDVFVSVAGGLSISEPASDLAVAAAVVSSAAQRALPPQLMVAGEIGLAGEVRTISRMETRLREAARLGFTQAVTPAGRSRPVSVDGLEVRTVQRIDEAVRSIFGDKMTQIG